jgi:hypothetical protein
MGSATGCTRTPAVRRADRTAETVEKDTMLKYYPARKAPWIGLACALVALGFAGNATVQAATVSLSFIRVSANAPVDVAGQLGATIWDWSEANSTFGQSLTADQILITITNDAGIASSISEVYIDDGTIFMQADVLNSLGGFTDFTGMGANPGDLPEGATVIPPFVATSAFSADAQGNPSKGVDTSADVLGLVYDLIPGSVFDDVLTALDDGELRIGFHIRAIGPESDSFMNEPPVITEPTGIPEPTSFAAGVVLLVGIGLFLRRRRA